MNGKMLNQLITDMASPEFQNAVFKSSAPPQSSRDRAVIISRNGP